MSVKVPIYHMSSILPDEFNMSVSDWCTFRGFKYLISCRGTYVSVFAAPIEEKDHVPSSYNFGSVQIISTNHPSPMTCAAFCQEPQLGRSLNGIFAVASRGIISIYAPVRMVTVISDFETYEWSCRCIIPCEGNVYALSWFPDASALFSGGTQFNLFRPEVSLLSYDSTHCQYSPEVSFTDTSPITRSALSCNCKLLATASIVSPVIKIWFYQNACLKSTIILNSNSAYGISKLQWKPYKNMSNINIRKRELLMCVSMSHEVSIYEESFDSDQLQFNLIHTIVIDSLKMSPSKLSINSHTVDDLSYLNPSSSTQALPPNSTAGDRLVACWGLVKDVVPDSNDVYFREDILQIFQTLESCYAKFRNGMPLLMESRSHSHVHNHQQHDHSPTNGPMSRSNHSLCGLIGESSKYNTPRSIAEGVPNNGNESTKVLRLYESRRLLDYIIIFYDRKVEMHTFTREAVSQSNASCKGRRVIDTLIPLLNDAPFEADDEESFKYFRHVEDDVAIHKTFPSPLAVSPSLHSEHDESLGMTIDAPGNEPMRSSNSVNPQRKSVRRIADTDELHRYSNSGLDNHVLLDTVISGSSETSMYGISHLLIHIYTPYGKIIHFMYECRPPMQAEVNERGFSKLFGSITFWQKSKGIQCIGYHNHISESAVVNDSNRSMNAENKEFFLITCDHHSNVYFWNAYNNMLYIESSSVPHQLTRSRSVQQLQLDMGHQDSSSHVESALIQLQSVDSRGSVIREMNSHYVSQNRMKYFRNHLYMWNSMKLCVFNMKMEYLASMELYNITHVSLVRTDFDFLMVLTSDSSSSHVGIYKIKYKNQGVSFIQERSLIMKYNTDLSELVKCHHPSHASSHHSSRHHTPPNDGTVVSTPHSSPHSAQLPPLVVTDVSSIRSMELICAYKQSIPNVLLVTQDFIVLLNANKSDDLIPICCVLLPNIVHHCYDDNRLVVLHSDIPILSMNDYLSSTVTVSVFNNKFLLYQFVKEFEYVCHSKSDISIWTQNWENELLFENFESNEAYRPTHAAPSCSIKDLSTERSGFTKEQEKSFLESQLMSHDKVIYHAKYKLIVACVRNLLYYFIWNQSRYVLLGTSATIVPGFVRFVNFDAYLRVIIATKRHIFRSTSFFHLPFPVQHFSLNKNMPTYNLPLQRLSHLYSLSIELIHPLNIYHFIMNGNEDKIDAILVKARGIIRGQLSIQSIHSDSSSGSPTSSSVSSDLHRLVSRDVESTLLDLNSKYYKVIRNGLLKAPLVFKSMRSSPASYTAQQQQQQQKQQHPNSTQSTTSEDMKGVPRPIDEDKYEDKFEDTQNGFSSLPETKQNVLDTIYSASSTGSGLGKQPDSTITDSLISFDRNYDYETFDTDSFMHFRPQQPKKNIWDTYDIDTTVQEGHGDPSTMNEKSVTQSIHDTLDSSAKQKPVTQVSSAAAAATTTTTTATNGSNQTNSSVLSMILDSDGTSNVSSNLLHPPKLVLSESEVGECIEFMKALSFAGVDEKNQGYLVAMLESYRDVFYRMKSKDIDHIGLSFLFAVKISCHPATCSRSVSSSQAYFALHSTSKDVLLSESVSIISSARIAASRSQDPAMKNICKLNSPTLLEQFLQSSENPSGLSNSKSASSKSMNSVKESTMDGNESEMIEWEDVKKTGVCLWWKHQGKYIDLALSIANNMYRISKDPYAGFLFYVVTKKLPLFALLFKVAKNEKLYNFFNRDFEDVQNQVSALKNAYVLLSRHEFIKAAGFLLLAKRTEEALNVIIKNCHDYQLALFLCVILEGENSVSYNNILRSHTLVVACANNDVSLRSMSYWLLGEFKLALQVYIDIVVTGNAVALVEPTRSFSDVHRNCACYMYPLADHVIDQENCGFRMNNNLYCKANKNDLGFPRLTDKTQMIRILSQLMNSSKIRQNLNHKSFAFAIDRVYYFTFSNFYTNGLTELALLTISRPVEIHNGSISGVNGDALQSVEKGASESKEHLNEVSVTCIDRSPTTEVEVVSGTGSDLTRSPHEENLGEPSEGLVPFHRPQQVLPIQSSMLQPTPPPLLSSHSQSQVSADLTSSQPGQAMVVKDVPPRVGAHWRQKPHHPIPAKVGPTQHLSTLSQVSQSGEVNRQSDVNQKPPSGLFKSMSLKLKRPGSRKMPIIRENSASKKNRNTIAATAPRIPFKRTTSHLSGESGGSTQEMAPHYGSSFRMPRPAASSTIDIFPSYAQSVNEQMMMKNQASSRKQKGATNRRISWFNHSLMSPLSPTSAKRYIDSVHYSRTISSIPQAYDTIISQHSLMNTLPTFERSESKVQSSDMSVTLQVAPRKEPLRDEVCSEIVFDSANEVRFMSMRNGGNVMIKEVRNACIKAITERLQMVEMVEEKLNIAFLDEILRDIRYIIRSSRGILTTHSLIYSLCTNSVYYEYINTFVLLYTVNFLEAEDSQDESTYGMNGRAPPNIQPLATTGSTASEKKMSGTEKTAEGVDDGEIPQKIQQKSPTETSRVNTILLLSFVYESILRNNLLTLLTVIYNPFHSGRKSRFGSGILVSLLQLMQMYFDSIELIQQKKKKKNRKNSGDEYIVMNGDSNITNDRVIAVLQSIPSYYIDHLLPQLLLATLFVSWEKKEDSLLLEVLKTVSSPTTHSYDSLIRLIVQVTRDCELSPGDAERCVPGNLSLSNSLSASEWCLFYSHTLIYYNALHFFLQFWDSYFIFVNEKHYCRKAKNQQTKSQAAQHMNKKYKHKNKKNMKTMKRHGYYGTNNYKERWVPPSDIESEVQSESTSDLSSSDMESGGELRLNEGSEYETEESIPDSSDISEEVEEEEDDVDYGSSEYGESMSDSDDMYDDNDRIYGIREDSSYGYERTWETDIQQLYIHTRREGESNISSTGFSETLSGQYYEPLYYPSYDTVPSMSLSSYQDAAYSSYQPMEMNKHDPASKDVFGGHTKNNDYNYLSESANLHLSDHFTLENETLDIDQMIKDNVTVLNHMSGIDKELAQNLSPLPDSLSPRMMMGVDVNESVQEGDKGYAVSAEPPKMPKSVHLTNEEYMRLIMRKDKNFFESDIIDSRKLADSKFASTFARYIRRWFDNIRYILRYCTPSNGGLLYSSVRPILSHFSNPDAVVFQGPILQQLWSITQSANVMQQILEGEDKYQNVYQVTLSVFYNRYYGSSVNHATNENFVLSSANAMDIRTVGVVSSSGKLPIRMNVRPYAAMGSFHTLSQPYAHLQSSSLTVSHPKNAHSKKLFTLCPLSEKFHVLCDTNARIVETATIPSNLGRSAAVALRYPPLSTNDSVMGDTVDSGNAMERMSESKTHIMFSGYSKPVVKFDIYDNQVENLLVFLKRNGKIVITKLYASAERKQVSLFYSQNLNYLYPNQLMSLPDQRVSFNNHSITSFELHNDLPLVMTANSTGLLQLVNIHNFRVLKNYVVSGTSSARQSHGIYFNNNGDYFFTENGDGHINMFDVTQATAEHQYKLFDRRVLCSAYIDNVVSCHLGRHTRRMNYVNRKYHSRQLVLIDQRMQCKDCHDYPVNDRLLNMKCDHCVYNTFTNSITLVDDCGSFFSYDLRQRCISDYVVNTSHPSVVNCIRYYSYRDMLVTGDCHGDIQVFDPYFRVVKKYERVHTPVSLSWFNSRGYKGITDMHIHGDIVYTSGCDGVIQYANNSFI